jgi:DNA (cytosine-5)-methyltransferase 1
MLTVGSLFAGIGGFDLGFERAGFELRWQVEIDPFCQAVLANHWPAVRRYEDVRTVHGPILADAETRRCDSRREPDQPIDPSPSHQSRLESHRSNPRRTAALAPVDVICGGFPCQPHSLAGRRAGADDERDLWPEFLRLIRELEPRWVVAENVPGLLSSDAGRFFGTVLGDLAACGYDAEWDCLPASAFGAPHRRDRIWIVAYPMRGGCEERSVPEGQDGPAVSDAARGSVAGADVADADESRSQRRISAVVCERADEWPAGPRDPRIFTTTAGQWREWEPESGFRRVAHGVPARVDRLRGLGNSIVPQIAEWLARRILDAEGLT